MAQITAENVSVDFPLYGGGSRSLKKTLLHMGTGGRISRDAADRVCVQALRGVSLELRQGDRGALVGDNGAGKTTLLRILAGIFEPSRGRVRREGQVSSLLSSSLGMDPEATGYENITLRGLLLGLDLAEIRERAEEIAAFTELGDFLAMPVHTYSSGMSLRLALAVSTCFEPDILLIDEWIGMGDAHFMEKAKARMDRFVERSTILVIASHSMPLIKRFCNKAVLLDRGEVAAAGTVDEVLYAYTTSATTP